MKKLLFGIGAVTATIFAVKKLIDNELEREYSKEKQWEEESDQEYVEEVEEIFAESENKDMSQGLWEQTKDTFKNVLEALPRVHVSITIEKRGSKEEK